MNPPTLINILRDRAAKEPEKMAYTFLVDGKHLGQSLTYGQLDRQARAIASHLRSHISQGDRALLIYPQGLEFLAAFFGCLYAGVIAIPTPAPQASRLNRLLPRLRSIIEDAGAVAILTTASLQSQLETTVTELAGDRVFVCLKFKLNYKMSLSDLMELS